MNKKLISIIICLILIMSCVTNVYAIDSNLESMDEILLQKGYPIEIIEKMSESAKEVICANPNLIYESGTTLEYVEHNGQLVEKTSFNGEDGITPFGQISTSTLELTWTVSLDTSANTNERLVIYSYNWLNMPQNRYDDPMAVSWNGDCYTMKLGSFYKVDKYHYINTFSGASGTATHSSEAGYANSSRHGVSWYADLKGYQSNVLVDKLYGHGQFILEKDAEPTTTERLYGHYVHNKSKATLNVLIPYVGSFSVSGGSDYDERGNACNFSL